MMKDVSMGDHAGHDERQRMMQKNSCLETAIANVQAAMAQLNSQDLFELVAADKEPGAASEDISDDFLLLVEEDESVEVRAQLRRKVPKQMLKDFKRFSKMNQMKMLTSSKSVNS